MIAGKGSYEYRDEPEILHLENLKKKKSTTHIEEEQAAEADEEDKKEDEEQKARNKIFADPRTKKPYDPDKKFGIIEDGTQQIYDRITTSYDCNLPPDYYLKYIQDQKPNSDTRWFIRPHHLETLTNHYNSIKDDILNTRYFSHYDKDYGVKKEQSNNEQALEYISKHVEQLKMK